MYVLHVTNNGGQKIQDEGLLNHIHKALTADKCFFNFSKEAVEVLPNQGHTMILLRGNDRLGLLSESAEVLTRYGCNIVNAEIWTHKHHAAGVIHVADGITGCQIRDSKKISRIKKDLQHLIKPPSKLRSPSLRLIPRNRRTDDVKITDTKIEETLNLAHGRSSGAHVTVSNYKDRGYTLVAIRSIDRLRLLLDTISALMVMQYVVFHGTATTGKTGAYQEYYIRHIDGRPIRTEAEREHLQKVLEETIDNPDSEGIELELSADGQLGHLSDIITVLKESGCWIKRAQISKLDGMVKHSYFVTDMSGKAVDERTIRLIQEQIGESILKVKKKMGCTPMLLQRRAKAFSISNLLKRLTLQIKEFFTFNRFA